MFVSAHIVLEMHFFLFSRVFPKKSSSLFNVTFLIFSKSCKFQHLFTLCNYFSSILGRLRIHSFFFFCKILTPSRFHWQCQGAFWNPCVFSTPSSHYVTYLIVSSLPFLYIFFFYSFDITFDIYLWLHDSLQHKEHNSLCRPSCTWHRNKYI